jgi:hypothetical protein
MFNLFELGIAGYQCCVTFNSRCKGKGIGIWKRERALNSAARKTRSLGTGSTSIHALDVHENSSFFASQKRRWTR